MRGYVGCLVLLVLATTTSAQAEHSIWINSPEAGDAYASGATIPLIGGSSSWIPFWDYAPTGVRIRVYNIKRGDIDGPIQSEVMATSFSNLTGNWSGSSAAPMGSPGPPTAPNDLFKLRADLIANGSSAVATDWRYLLVGPYGGGS